MAVELSCTDSRARRRSLNLKTLLQLPLLSRAPGFALNPISTGRDPGHGVSLPGDILRDIAEQLSPNDILSVSLTASRVRELLIPELYRTVHLRSSRSCESGLRMLEKRPELCAYIQKLAVRPNYYLAWPTRDAPLSEDVVASTICRIAPALVRLRTFDWDGLEMPRDDLWLVLRNSCPELKELFSNVGYQLLDPESELFKFSDLTNFSLSVRHGLGETDIFPEHEELPAQLWDLLLTRCPTLTELTLCSFSASHRLFALGRVAEGRWPALSSLTLGAFGYTSDFTLAAPPAVTFDAFLAAHPDLAYLRLAWNFKRWMSPDDAEGLPIMLPPRLDSYSGVVQQLPGAREVLASSPGAASTSPSPALMPPTNVLISPTSTLTPSMSPLTALTSLDLMCEPLYAARAPALCAALRSLPLLTGLELWVHVPDPRAGHEAFFRDLWGAAPGLEDLHFMCTTAFGKKPLTELARALRLLPRLHTFALTKGHRYADESMRHSAERVWRALYGAQSASGISDAQNSRRKNTKRSSWGDWELDSGDGEAAREDVNVDRVDAGRDSQTGDTPWTTPRLTQVSVRWARAACRNHLKQEGTYERVAAAPPTPTASLAGSTMQITNGKARKRRSFLLNTVTKAEQDGSANTQRLTTAASKTKKRPEPVMVEAWERGLRAVGGAFERRYRFALPVLRGFTGGE